MADNIGLGLIILLTGIVIVFTVLILLIGIIKLYSTAVVTIQNTISERKSRKADDESQKSAPAAESQTTETIEAEQTVSDSIEDDAAVPGEIVAAIAAAIEVIFGEGTVKIKSIKKSSKRRSAWKSAGMAENTRSF